MADDLTTQGIAALKAGDKAKARQLLKAAVASNPNDEVAWLWLSGTVESNEERFDCLKKVQSINPNNEAARLGLDLLQRQQAQQVRKIGSPQADGQISSPLKVSPAQESFPTATQVKRLPQNSETYRATKKCPYCAEEIQADAVVCPFCERDLLSSKSSSQRSQTSRGTAPKSLEVITVLVIIVALLVVVSKMGMYTVQPIGALPQGATLVIWRASGEPFFNSPDAVCLKVLGSVSLLCRGSAMSLAPVDRIILRLPYIEWAYLMSTGGRTFDR